MPYSKKPILPAVGRPPKHASRAIARFVRENTLDRRTAVSKIYERAADLMADDAGGWPCVSNRQSFLIRYAAGLWVELHVYQTHRLKRLARGESPGDENDRYYVALMNAFRRILESLGLRPECVEKQLPSLAEYIATRQTAAAPTATGVQPADVAASAPSAAGDGQIIDPDDAEPEAAPAGDGGAG